MVIKLGVLGVDDLTAKMVCGLLQHHADLEIFLSPPNQVQPTGLDSHLACNTLESPQEVVHASEILLLSLTPEQMINLAQDVSVKPNQKIVSLVHGVSISELSTLFKTPHCFRASSSYSAEINHSTIALFPYSSCIHELLHPLGRLITLESENSFDIATIGHCLNGWFYFLLHDLHHWLHEKGLSKEQAKELVLSHLEDCIAYSRHYEAQPLLQLGQSIASNASFTAQGLEMLQLHQANAAWSAACEVVFDAISTPSLTSQPLHN